MRRSAREIARRKMNTIQDEIGVKKKKLSHGAKIMRQPNDNDDYVGFVFGSQGRAWYAQGCRLFTIEEAYVHWDEARWACASLMSRDKNVSFRHRYMRAIETLDALDDAQRYATRKGWKSDV